MRQLQRPQFETLPCGEERSPLRRNSSAGCPLEDRKEPPWRCWVPLSSGFGTARNPKHEIKSHIRNRNQKPCPESGPGCFIIKVHFLQDSDESLQRCVPSSISSRNTRIPPKHLWRLASRSGDHTVGFADKCTQYLGNVHHSDDNFCSCPPSSPTCSALHF